MSLAWGIQLEFLLSHELAVQWCIMYNWTSMVWIGNNRKCPQWTFVLTVWSYRIEANLEEAGHLRQYFKILPSPWPFLCLLLGCHGVNCDPYHALLSTYGWNLLNSETKQMIRPFKMCSVRYFNNTYRKLTQTLKQYKSIPVHWLKKKSNCPLWNNKGWFNIILWKP